MSAVHRFYDEYYFRPKAVFRILRKAAFDSNDRKRLYKEAKSVHEAALGAQQAGQAAQRRSRGGSGAGEGITRQVSKFHVSRFQGGPPLESLGVFETLKLRNPET
jgi:hypothetical protein